MTISIENQNGSKPARPLGTVRIAPSVLATIIHSTTLAVDGVVRMGSVTNTRNRFFNRDHSEGVKIEMHEDKVCAALYIVVDKDANLASIGKQVQNEVSKAIRLIVGMPVEEINVYIQNVE